MCDLRGGAPTWPDLGRTPSAAAIACAGILIRTHQSPNTPARKRHSARAVADSADGIQGAFQGWAAALQKVTVADAVQHPN
ncbi:MAG: hypothetical protein OXF67_01950 [Cyanobacteria bacterium MAG CAR4_bin_6]|nr:hypothetical protein [Cyanobacteria bacterium MAG CAR4_bin_6]